MMTNLKIHCLFCPSIQHVIIALSLLVCVVQAFPLLGSHLPKPQCTTLNAKMEVWCDCRTSNEFPFLEPPIDVNKIPDILVMQRSSLGIFTTSPLLQDLVKTYKIPIFVQDNMGRLHSFLQGTIVGSIVKITDVSGQGRALAALGSGDWVLVFSNDWKMIQAENLIAAAHLSNTKIAFGVKRPEDVGGLAYALEKGVDALCVDASAPNDVWEAAYAARGERDTSMVKKKVIPEKTVTTDKANMKPPISPTSEEVIIDSVPVSDHSSDDKPPDSTIERTESKNNMDQDSVGDIVEFGEIREPTKYTSKSPSRNYSVDEDPTSSRPKNENDNVEKKYDETVTSKESNNHLDQDAVGDIVDDTEENRTPVTNTRGSPTRNWKIDPNQPPLSNSSAKTEKSDILEEKYNETIVSKERRTAPFSIKPGPRTWKVDINSYPQKLPPLDDANIDYWKERKAIQEETTTPYSIKPTPRSHKVDINAYSDTEPTSDDAVRNNSTLKSQESQEMRERKATPYSIKPTPRTWKVDIDPYSKTSDDAATDKSLSESQEGKEGKERATTPYSIKPTPRTWKVDIASHPQSFVTPDGVTTDKSLSQRQEGRERQESFDTVNTGKDISDNVLEGTKPNIVTGKCFRRLISDNSVVLADRVCVDLLQRLSPTEGCWIGSSAKSMTLILSEAAASEFVPAQPFRINAGPLHSYILMGDNKTTKYLSELKPSDQVLAYDTKTGTTRSVTVGRVNEEVCPCVVVQLESSKMVSGEGDSEDEEERGIAQIFLQQAETVRLGQDEGGFVRVTDLEVAESDQPIEDEKKQKVLLRLMSTGTHVGRAYDGKVLER